MKIARESENFTFISYW